MTQKLQLNKLQKENKHQKLHLNKLLKEKKHQNQLNLLLNKLLQQLNQLENPHLPHHLKEEKLLLHLLQKLVEKFPHLHHQKRNDEKLIIYDYIFKL